MTEKELTLLGFKMEEIKEYDDDIVEMLEESWYYSVIEDIVEVFNQYGKEYVLTDVANRLIELENNSK